ncbi:MAG: HPr(Ser) kinase/phosphatase [Candidatus Hydrogenedentota bacterium]|uniref:HPr kinase/phosphorylase n=1 Tax=Sumerlaea chitinivorans TaxID=2250252 RepID=A0A2Z4Y544_SUMC1|nr:HPr kinase/phosphorylase [Candidatus Sumerlaea chitinivorans]RMH27594.1 MAG: HPr(Ser) kinase/phosphatase [Candidatus Hydrogenedentota bacterium]
MAADKKLSIRELLDSCSQDMDLELVAGERGLQNVIRTAEITRPGLAFAGFYDVFAYDRIQIIGNTEMSYLRSLGQEERQNRLDRVFQFKIPCFIVTNANPIPKDFMEKAELYGVPLLRTTLMTTRLVSHLNAFLERFFAPEIGVHGELLDVYGMGLLILGASGVGKSEAALELVERGHRLVADDYVWLRRLSKYEIVGRSDQNIRYMMEIRGLGLLNVEMMFGVASVVEEKRVDLVVQLERWDESREYERLGLDERYHIFFDDVKIPEYIIPVQPGRNISLLLEMAALSQRLKNAGRHPADTLERQLIERVNAESAEGQDREP